MKQPIRIHPVDKTDEDVRTRHQEIENRLDALGLEAVKIKMLHGGLPTEWHPIVTAWMSGDKLAADDGGTETA